MSAFAEQLGGVLPALVSPLREDDSIDTAAVTRIVEYLIAGGVGGIWALGSGGEFASLTFSQRSDVIYAAVEAARGRVPVLAGVSDTCVANIFQHVAAAEDAGASGVFCVPPFYFIPTPAQIVEFYLEFADRSPLPVVVYHNPFNAKGRLDLAAFKKLLAHPNIAGMKDSSCDLAFFQDILHAAREREEFRVIQGHDPLLVPAALLGAHGAVAAAAGIAPKLVVSLFAAAKSGNVAVVSRLNTTFRQLNAVFTVGGEPTDQAFLSGQKAAMEVLGLCGRKPTAPFKACTDGQVELIRGILRSAGLGGATRD